MLSWPSPAPAQAPAAQAPPTAPAPQSDPLTVAAVTETDTTKVLAGVDADHPCLGSSTGSVGCRFYDKAHKLDALDFFKRFAVSPEELPDTVSHTTVISTGVMEQLVPVCEHSQEHGRCWKAEQRSMLVAWHFSATPMLPCPAC
jgi:hypothetical protein